jgi:hypothetical protein
MRVTPDRHKKKNSFYALLVERFHDAFENERYSEALQLMEIYERLEIRKPFGTPYF